MRVSAGHAPPVNGCVDTSKRPLPKSKPMSLATAAESAACASVESFQPGWSKARAGCTASSKPARFFSRTLARSGAKPAFVSAKIESKRADVMPRSNWSRAPS